MEKDIKVSVRLDADTKKALQIKVIQENTSVQALLEAYIKKYIGNK